jgi:hypothetical protein
LDLALRIVGLAARVLMALGLGCLLLGGYLAWRTLAFSSSAEAVTGKVVSYHEFQDDGKARYRPRVRFQTRDGSIHTITGQMAYTSRRYAEGAELPVLFQDGEPGKARIATFFDNWLGATIAVMVGLLSIAGGILVRRGSRAA